MSISKTGCKYNRQNWEDSEFPILCETCLGDNPYVRMLKDKFGKECHVCARPYTSFRWLPGKRMRYKTTEVCQICAKLKNVCQTCLLDLDYSLPVQVRDAVLNIKSEIPRAETNCEYYRQIIEAKVSDKDPTALVGEMVGKARKENEILKRIARTQPYYDRNKPHLCSFWQKGACKRGEECPYRHEMPSIYDKAPSKKNIRDRYHGVEDQVAEKIMSKMGSLPKVEHPKNHAITTLCILGVNSFINEEDLNNYFYQFGEIKKIFISKKSGCAFINFQKRKDAEIAIEATFNRLVINDQSLTAKWSKNQPVKEDDFAKLLQIDSQFTVSELDSDPMYPDPMKITDETLGTVTVEIQNQKIDVEYPSENPFQLGSKKK